MSLITCPECGKEISDKAKSCPHCGYPICDSEENISVHKNIDSLENGTNKIYLVQKIKDKYLKMGRKGKTTTIVVIAIIIVITCLVFIPIGDEKAALNDAKFIKNICKVPSSFKVMELSVCHEKTCGLCTYITYEAENSYGAKIRSVAVFHEDVYLGEYGDSESNFSSLDEYDEFVVTCAAYEIYNIYGKYSGYKNLNSWKINLLL